MDEIKKMWLYDLRAKAADDTTDGLNDEAASNLPGYEDVRTTRRNYLRRGIMRAEKWVVGDENDQAAFARLKRALGDLRSFGRDHWNGVAGSQDI
jgi:hypothetical protein